MASSKTRILFLLDLLRTYTDDEHFLTREEIMDKMDEAGYKAMDRKVVYSDIEALKEYGIDIITQRQNRQYYYSIGARDFEMVELKLLVDSIQAAKFISEDKSTKLIKNLEPLVSVHEAGELHRNVLISGKMNTSNEMIFYSVDSIFTAINKNRKITFKYGQWNAQKQLKPRRESLIYKVSPWTLIWDDEYYYLVAYDDRDQKIKHYRVDKMMEIGITDEERTGRDEFRKENVRDYQRRVFGMFGGETRTVVLECEDGDKFYGIIIDRFGKDIIISRNPEKGIFRVVVDVVPSPQFYGWLFSLGEGIRIVSPDDVVDECAKAAESIYRQFGKK